MKWLIRFMENLIHFLPDIAVDNLPVRFLPFLNIPNMHLLYLIGYFYASNGR